MCESVDPPVMGELPSSTLRLKCQRPMEGTLWQQGLVQFFSDLSGLGSGHELSFPGLAAANPPADQLFEEVLAVNPGLAAEELESAVLAQALEDGLTREQVIQILWEDSREARSVLAGANEGMGTRSSGGNDGQKTKLGCAYPGMFTYSFSDAAVINHGHNTLFVEACSAVHMPGGDIPNIRRINSSYTGLRHKPAYPAHVRRVAGASYNMLDRAGNFGLNRLAANVEYNNVFAFNKTVWGSEYNCSSLVWAAWMYASTNNVDLDSNDGYGVYPEDLWKSPLTVLSRYLEIA